MLRRVQAPETTCELGCGQPARHGSFCFEHMRGWARAWERRLFFEYGPFSDAVYEICVAFYVARVKHEEVAAAVVARAEGMGLKTMVKQLLGHRDWAWSMDARDAERDED